MFNRDKKQRLTTLKRLKRGDDNELERNLKLEVVYRNSGWPWRQKKKEEQEMDKERKSRLEKMVAYRTAHVSHRSAVLSPLLSITFQKYEE